ncbi:MAG: hypothetical protein ABIH23_02385, partial [bacterium]
GLWIGFAGVFLGMGLGGIRYRSRELLLLMAGVLAAYFIGVSLLNAPFDPDNGHLPVIYFSDHWHWEPDTVLEPRYECWGGLLLALATVIVYTRWRRKDRLALRLALWGILGGALGFPLGESVQAFHSWNPEIFKQGLWSRLGPFMNWWNMMETTFGAVMGGILGLGLWINRKRIQLTADAETVSMPSAIEWILLAVHLTLLVAVEFMSFPAVDALYDLGLIMGVIPIVAIAGGRWWPYLMVFPVTLLPIAGKTVYELVYQKSAIDPTLGWLVYLVIPLFLAIAAAVRFGRQPATRQTGRDFARFALLLNTWVYFYLNYAFFRYPWPWADWTGRTPNGIIFTVCALGLTAAALTGRRARVAPE